MNELQIFNYQSNEVRTVMKDGEPWFVLKDVCAVLGIVDHKVVSRRLDKDEVYQIPLTDSMGRQQATTIINESGLYSVILRSDKPEAKPFRKWVTAEVLFSIRKTGAYTNNVLPDINKATLEEAKLNNSKARLASVWLKLAKINPIPEYQQICAHYASTILAGKEVLPLPDATERTYSAKEVGEMLGGISANRVGRIANKNGLKVPEFGVQVWDKSPNSAKQIPSWRYNDKAVARLKEILGGGVA